MPNFLPSRLVVLSLFVTWLFIASSPCFAKDKPSKGEKKKEDKLPQETPGDNVFGLTKVHEIHLTFSAKEWDAIQPAAGGGFPGFPGGPGSGGPGFPGGPGRPDQPAERLTQPAEKKADEKPEDPDRETHRGAFGTRFPWTHSDLKVGDAAFPDVGIRYKGNASYMSSSRSLKRSMKIDLDRHNDVAPRWDGLKKINLNSGVMDSTKGREAFAYSVFRAAGIPAPRTAFAEVTLTVPDKHDHEYVGLFTVIEQVDKTFLKTHFQNSKGLLLKPEGVNSFDYFGDDWSTYEARYHPDDPPSKAQAKRVIAFAKLVHKADDERFRDEVGLYLDVDQFLRYIAVNALVVNLDSLFSIGHNYYIYLNPETNKFVFLPWDLDLSLAGFPMGGSPDQQLDLSLNHPHGGEHKLIDRLLAMPEMNEKYQQILKELVATCFTKERLLQDIETIEKTTRELVAKDKKAADARKETGFGFGPPGGGRPGGGRPGGGGFGPPPGGGPPGGGPPGGMFGQSPDLRKFVEKRTASVAAQLAGTSKGFVPARMGFGPPGGGPGGGFGGFGPPGFAPPGAGPANGNREGRPAPRGGDNNSGQERRP